MGVHGFFHHFGVPVVDIGRFVIPLRQFQGLLGSASNRRMTAPYCRRKASHRVTPKGVSFMSFAECGPVQRANLFCLPQEGADHRQPEPDWRDVPYQPQARRHAEWSPLS